MCGLFNRLAVLIFVLGHACVGLQYGWKPKQEFNFQVDGQSVVGLTQTGQHTGFEYKGQMSVQTVKENTLHLKLMDFTYNKFRSKTVAPLRITSATIVVQLCKPREPRLLLPPGGSDWEINFIKGLVSFITVSYGRDLASRGPNYKNENPLDENEYSIMEDTVVGRCQVLYEVHSQPKRFNTVDDADNSEFCRDQPVVEIAKTVNYSNCEVLHEDSYGLPVGYNKQADDYENIFNRASSTRLTGCGTKRSFVLVSSISESKIISKLHARNGESLVSSSLHVKLRSVQVIQTTVVPPPDYKTVSGLQYHYQCQDESSRNVQKQLDLKISQEQSVSDEPKDNINPKPDGKFESEEEYEDFLVYERRKRSSRKGKKFPKYTHVRRGKPNNESSSDEYVSGVSEKVKTKLADSTSCVPHDKPYTPFFLAYRFAVTCNASDPSPTPHAKEKLNRLLDQITAELANASTVVSANTLEKISIAADYARLLALQDLQELSKSVFENVSYPEYETQEAIKRNVFRDVVTLSGQRPSFKLISDWIKNKQIDGEEAAQIVSALPSYLTPSDMYILREFFDLMVAVYNGSDHQLKVTIILGFSNYVRVSTLAAGTINESQDVKQYADWLETHLSDDESLELVLVRAIGNMPGNHTLGILKSLAMEKRLSVYKRSMAVFSMVYSALYFKLPTTITLMSLYHNESLPTPVRISAVSLLFYSTQDISTWQGIALSTWFGEQTPVVSAFVWNTLQNLANNRDARYSFLIKAATQVKSMAKPVPDVTHQPFNIITASAVHKLNTLKFKQLEWLDFSDFQSLYFRHSTRSSGLSRINFQTELSATNFYGFLYDLISQPEENSQNTIFSHSTQWIKNTLNIKSRVMPSFEANLQLKIDNLMERMFSLDKKGLDDLAKELRQLLNEIINNAKNFYYQKSGMKTSLRIATTTEMGFPVEFRVEEPWSIRTSARLQCHSNFLNFNITFMYASQMISDIGVYSSWDSKQYTVGIQTLNLLQLPHISLIAQYIKRTRLVQIKTKEIERSLVFYQSTTPFLVQRRVQYPKPTIVGVYAESLYNGTVNQDSVTLFGLPIEIKTEGETSLIEEIFVATVQVANKFKKVSPAERQKQDALHQARKTVEPYKLEATVSGLQPMNVNFSIGLAVVENGKKRIKTGKRITTLATHQFKLNKLSSLLSDNDDKEDGSEKRRTSDLILPQYLSNDMSVLTTKVKGQNMMMAPLSGTVTKPAGTTISFQPEFPQIQVTTSRPSTTPTEPSTTSTEPSTISTEPSTTPSEPSTTSTELWTTPTEPLTTSTEAWTTPTEPLTTSTGPWTTPTEPLTTSTELWTTPTEPSITSTEPSTIPSESLTTSTEPSTTPSEPLTTLFTEPSTTCTESSTASTSCPPNLQQVDHIITETIHSTDYSLQLRKFNASSGDPFADQIIGSARDYLLLTVLDGLENGKAYAVDFNFTMGDVNISATLTHAFTLDSLLQRFGTFIKVGNDYQNGLTATIIKPVTPLFDVRDFVDASPKSDLFIDFTHNDIFHDMIQGTITSWKFDKSPSFDIDDCALTIPGTAIGPDCRRLINQMSSRIGRLKLNVSGSVIASHNKQICLDFSNIYNRAAFPLFDEPEEIQENCTLLPNFPYYSQLVTKSYEPAYCGITTKRVITFDKAEYFYSVSRSWHLAAQDCSGQRQVAILTRSSPSNTNVDIEVNVGNSANLTIKSEEGLFFNGQDKSITESNMYLFYSKEDGQDVVIMRVYRSPDNAIGIQLPRHGFDITYAYAFIVINANPSMRGRLCGLCGSYTNEGEEKYLLPDGNHADSTFRFAHSYDLRD